MDKDLEIYLNLLEMATPRVWTDERVALFKKLHDEGKSPSEIASELGITITAYEDAFRKIYKNRKKTIINWTADRITQLKKLCNDGKSTQEIADLMGIDYRL